MGKIKAHTLINRQFRSVTKNILYAFIMYPATGFLPFKFKKELMASRISFKTFFWILIPFFL